MISIRKFVYLIIIAFSTTVSADIKCTAFGGCYDAGPSVFEQQQAQRTEQIFQNMQQQTYQNEMYWIQRQQLEHLDKLRSMEQMQQMKNLMR